MALLHKALDQGSNINLQCFGDKFQKFQDNGPDYLRQLNLDHLASELTEQIAHDLYVFHRSLK